MSLHFKRALPLLALLILPISAMALKVSGKVTGLTAGDKIVLQNILGDTLCVSPNNNGSFELECRNGASVYMLTLGEYRRTLYLDKDVTVSGLINSGQPKASKINFSGTESNNTLAGYLSKVSNDSNAFQQEALGKLKNGVTKEEEDTILASISGMYFKTDYAVAMMKTISDTELAAAFAFMMRGEFYDTAKQLYDQLPAEATKSYSAQMLRQFMEQKIAPRLGDVAPDFELTDVNGKKHNLKSYRGKIVVLDFWASWCGPCRSEMVYLKNYWKEIKDKNVVFISISLDNTEQLWKTAHQEEQIPWVSLWGGAWESSQMRKLYDFYSIPHVVVIDKNGIYQGCGYRRSALKEKINQLL